MNIQEKSKGYVAALLSSATFGLIPLFTVPLMRMGYTTENILIYRFAFATAFIALVMGIKKIPFRLRERRYMMILLGLSLLYFFSALLLINGYKAMNSGMATVIHFMYPLMVALLMLIFFGQKMSIRGVVALIMAFCGVVLLSGILSQGETGQAVSFGSIGKVALSGLCYALYIIVVNKSGIAAVPMWRFSFYLMLFCTIYFLAFACTKGTVEVPSSPTSWGLLFLLGLVPTVISNMLLVIAIPKIGSTATSIMGVMEPLTAVVVGILVLGEKLSLSTGVGMGVILLAVWLLVTDKKGAAA